MLNFIKKVWISNRTAPVIVRLRHFQHVEYGQEFAAERFAYSLIDRQKISVPDLIAVDPSGEVCGFPFAVFEFITGTTLDRLLKVDLCADFSRKEQLLSQLGRMLAAVHAALGAGYGTLSSIKYASSERHVFWRQLFDNELQRLRLYDDVLTNEISQAVPACLNILAGPTQFHRPCLIHGDLHGKNIIVTHANELVLIDWEAAKFRIAAYDFAQIKYCNLKDNALDWSWLVDAYVEARADGIKLSEFAESIAVCEAFWHLRMGLFQRQFSFGEGSYFGTWRDHLSAAQSLFRRFS